MTEDQLVFLVRRYRELNAVALEVKQEQEDIKALIDREVEDGWAVEIDGVVANKRRGNRRFSRALAVGLLSPSERLDCVETVYSDALLRSVLESKDLLDQAMEDVGQHSQVRLI